MTTTASTTTPTASNKNKPTLTWSDEFDGAAGSPPNPAKWTAVTGGGGWGNQELECYTARPSNVQQDGLGHLAITARAERYTDSAGRTCGYTSARLQTRGLFAQQYGELEASMKLPAGRGLWPAFWALGADHDTAGWPACGEIDVMESLGSNPFKIYGSIHGPLTTGGPFGITTAHTAAGDLSGGFHTYGVNWSPNQIQYTLDGIVYATYAPASLSASQLWVFNSQPFYLLLNLAVGGSWPGPPSASTQFPATLLVDSVRVYS